MRGFVAVVMALMVSAAICSTSFAGKSADESAGKVERLALWPGMEEWLQSEGRGYIVPTVETTDWIGFINEGNRVRGLDKGDSFRYIFDREGTFYLGIIATDDSDGVEILRVTFNGRELGTLVGDDDNGKALYSFPQPMKVKKGDVLDFTCIVPVGCYRIYDLVFAKQRILPPRPSFKYIETWSKKPGDIDICWTTTGIVKTGRVEYQVADCWKKSAISKVEGRNHRIRLRGLDPATEYMGRIITTWRGKEFASKPFTFRAISTKKTVTKAQTIDLIVPEPTDTPRRAWPATFGMPFSRGTLARTSDLSLTDPLGERVTLQAAATSLWDDGSVKWAILSFMANSNTAGESRAYQLNAMPRIAAEVINATPVLSIAESDEGWSLTTKLLNFTIAKKGAVFFGCFGFDENGDGTIGGKELVQGTDASGLVLETGNRQAWTCAAPNAVDILENGPIRAVVRCEGKMQNSNGGSEWCYLVRLTFWRSMPSMAVNVTMWNGAGEPLFRRVRRLSVNVPLPGGTKRRCAFQGQKLAQVADGEVLRLFQDEDAHFTQSHGENVTEGERAVGLATMSHGTGLMSLLHRDFWQTYPSALVLNTTGLRVDLLPSLKPEAYTVLKAKEDFHRLYPWFEDGCYLMRAGQTTQHEFHLWFDADDSGKAAARHTAWRAQPLLPRASCEYLCSTGVLGGGIFPKTPGVWDSYESYFDRGFARLLKARESNRMYGWMNFGDWYGERGYNAGNNEYDLAWCLGLQWMRTGDRRYFNRGLEMARHYATVDTIRGEWAKKLPGLVWEHSFNHVGTRHSPEALGFDHHAKNYTMRNPGTFEGGMDPQGHIFEDGVWLYGLLTGDTFLLKTAEQVCTRQADFLTPTFDFEIERAGGWPLINATGAYLFTSDPYYLNAARIMVQRCLERHDPRHGGWPHVPPLNETRGVPVVGGKAFATGVLTFGLLRYLDVETMERPEVKQMLLNTADWLMNESWEVGNGFKYITNSPKHVGQGKRGHECLMNASIIGYAYKVTGNKKYLEFWEEMMAGAFDGTPSGFGKSFSQATRQTVFGIDHARKAGIKSCKPLDKE